MKQYNKIDCNGRKVHCNTYLHIANQTFVSFDVSINEWPVEKKASGSFEVTLLLHPHRGYSFNIQPILRFFSGE